MERTQVASLPPVHPSKRSERKILKQAEVNLALWNAVEKEADKSGHTTREIFEYGLKAWLLSKNEREAAKLGIHKAL